MAVGIFDSGLGGLTVLDAVSKTLADQSFVYFAEHANAPYGVRTADDISRLAYIPNISGALVGRALFRKTIDLSEALSVASAAHEPVAEFQ